MGRYKEYRDQPRRGYGEEQVLRDREFDAPLVYPTGNRPQPADPVVATVTWFDAGKGFGFVALPDGKSAFLHIRQLEAAGHVALAEGVRLKVRVGPSQKGTQVTEVVEVTTDIPVEPLGRSIDLSSQPARSVTAEQMITGTVKWYDGKKGFGFIAQSAGGNDVFVHAKTVERSRLGGLIEGQRVRMAVEKTQKGLEARSIEVLD
jgi:CspA family cold shock protein